ncbi:MAG: phosphoribosyl-AMP cyclohydrolase [Chloroflexia bacterium]
MNELRFDEQGLVPVVVQNADTDAVLLLAYTNAEALAETFRTGLLYLWSRSRGKLWLKGETSGNYQRVADLRVNCEGNSLLALVHSMGPVCHDGYESCFYRQLDAVGNTTFIAERMFDPEVVYDEQVKQ